MNIHILLEKCDKRQVRRSKLPHTVTLLTCILEVLGLILVPNNDYSE
jgi:hypothetical protein